MKIISAKHEGHELTVHLTLFKRFLFKVNGRLFLFYERDNSMYLAKCRLHGYYIDYPHGDLNVLRCPICDKKFLEESKYGST